MAKVIKFLGIGTHWYIEIFDDVTNKEFEKLEEEILALVNIFENNYSRFIDSSIISTLNREKRITNISDELLELINLGIKAYEITEGHFNISVGGVLESMGYDKAYSFKSKDLSKKIQTNVKINGRNITIGENTKIDLGGIGKGYLIDEVKDLIIKSGIEYFFINAGGDIYATSDNGKEIEFALENPFNITEMIGKISIKNESIASSSNAKRNWVDKNTKNKYGHLIDMKSQDTVSKVMGVYTLSNSPVNADIASTCLFVSSRDLYQQIAKYYEVEYLIVYEDKSFIKSLNYKGEMI